MFSLALVGLAFLAWRIASSSETSRTEVLDFNRKMQARFEATAVKIEAFQRANNRLPEIHEFNQFADRTPIPFKSSPLHGPSSGPYLVTGRSIDSCSESDEELASLKKASFVLGMGNGDWEVCFASSPPVSTLALKPEDFSHDSGVLRWRLIALTLLAGAALINASRWSKRKAV